MKPKRTEWVNRIIDNGWEPTDKHTGCGPYRRLESGGIQTIAPFGLYWLYSLNGKPIARGSIDECLDAAGS